MMPRPDLKNEISAAKKRVETATDIAEHFRENDRLHRLSMETVFLLEDIVVTLVRMQDAESEKNGSGSSLPDSSAS